MSDDTPSAQQSKSLAWHKTAIAVACVAVLLLTLTVLLQKAREFARDKQWRYQQEHIATCLQNHRRTHGDFPPAAVLDENGHPMHSWRALLVPYLEKNWFYDRYDLEDPWNGPQNQLLLQECIEEDEYLGPHDITSVRQMYQPVSVLGSDSFCTYLVMVTDPSQPTVRSKNYRGWQHRVSVGDELMLVALRKSDIHWMEPRDLSLDEIRFPGDDPSNPTSCYPQITGSFIVPEEGEAEFLDEAATWKRLREMVEAAKQP